MNNEKLTIKRDIVERTYGLAPRIIKFVKTLPKETSVFVLGRQLVASGTSIAANVEEAQGAFSKDDLSIKCRRLFSRPSRQIYG